MVQRSFEGRLWQQWMDRIFMPRAVTDHVDTLPFAVTPAARRRSMIVAPSSRKSLNALAAAAATIRRRRDPVGWLALRILSHLFHAAVRHSTALAFFDIRLHVPAASQSTTAARQALFRCDTMLEVRWARDDYAAGRDVSQEEQRAMRNAHYDSPRLSVRRLMVVPRKDARGESFGFPLVLEQRIATLLRWIVTVEKRRRQVPSEECLTLLVAQSRSVE